MQRYHLKRQFIFCGDVAAHLYIFFRRAIAFIRIKADADIEQVQVVALFQKSVYGHCAVNAT